MTPRFRAPRHDAAILAQPDLGDVGPLLEHNRRLLAAPTPGDGLPLHELRLQARREAVAAASAYQREAGEPVPAGAAATPLLLAGHQPELFHLGVWIKNFALNGLARRHGLVPLNLVVDNDAVKSTFLRLPTPPSANTGGARLLRVAFDAWQGEAPYEERPVRDEALFASFAERAGSVLAAWGLQSILPAFWKEVLRQAGRTALLGERFAAARRALERAWGCHNLELPVSRLADSPAFGRFALQLLADRERVHRVYNEVVGRYRQEHGLRSQNQPVPDLAADGDWREVPLWGWRAGRMQGRGRLFARQAGRRLELRSGKEAWPDLPVEPSLDAWQALQEQGYRVRPRALTTTLYCRLFLADLFIHGIGGGLYDELTDEIVRRLYEIEPPGYLVLSGTLLLPLPAHAVQDADRLRLMRKLRDLHWTPERELSADTAELCELLQRKQTLIREAPARQSERRQRFEAIRAVTAALRPRLADERAETARRLARVRAELTENAVLQRRDYAFCLFPEEKIRPFCTQFLESRARG